MKITLEVELEYHRCWTCGKVWYNEVGCRTICPVCAAKKVAQAEEEVAAMCRSNSALRGALKRKK